MNTEYMRMASRYLQIKAQFLYLPGCMLVSFDDSATHTAEVKLVRVSQGIDLGKLGEVQSIYKEVQHDKLELSEAISVLDEIFGRKQRYVPWKLVLVYGVASASVGPFAFDLRPIDMPVAFLLGTLLGIMQLVIVPNSDLYNNVFEISAAVLTSFLARAFGSIKRGQLFCFSALAQSAIALILPGYSVCTYTPLHSDPVHDCRSWGAAHTDCRSSGVRPLLIAVLWGHDPCWLLLFGVVISTDCVLRVWSLLVLCCMGRSTPQERQSFIGPWLNPLFGSSCANRSQYSAHSNFNPKTWWPVP